MINSLQQSKTSGNYSGLDLNSLFGGTMPKTASTSTTPVSQITPQTTGGTPSIGEQAINQLLQVVQSLVAILSQVLGGLVQQLGGTPQSTTDTANTTALAQNTAQTSNTKVAEQSNSSGSSSIFGKLLSKLGNWLFDDKAATGTAKTDKSSSTLDSLINFGGSVFSKAGDMISSAASWVSGLF